MKASKIPVVRVSRGQAVGTPDEFEKRFEKSRQRHSPTVRQSELEPIKNPSLDQRLRDFNIETTE